MKLWLGKNPSFSAEFITDNMKRELVDYYHEHCDTMTHEDVAKHFGLKWQRKPTLLKKQLQRSLLKQPSENSIEGRWDRSYLHRGYKYAATVFRRYRGVGLIRTFFFLRKSFE